ncbi:hypothetical protein IFM89_034216 [Coptis chinensis]|uniref:DET1- and DDB1-associated protein 1 domain-containing protein n=1 Tax=Coptis chinensis TaxID=261450 RepID=A0A835LK61_9MAGN|nr:hypothetical protein IFM89_034216 [Coptis chinensis]
MAGALTHTFLVIIKNQKELTAATYHPTHDPTSAPPDQVIATEATNILEEVLSTC